MNTYNNLTKKRKKIYEIAFLGIMVALSVALIWLLHFPIFPQVPFLEYDPGDITIIISTTIFGPAAGIIVTVIASIVQGVTVSAGSGVYGIIMHIIATGSYVLAFGFINRRHSELGRQIIAAITATLVMVVMMFFANLLITPYFLVTTVDILMSLMPFILLFNFVKASVNSVLALLIYRTVKRFIKI